MFKGFRDFIMRGNVIDLAVAVVIGAAFAKLIDAFTAAFITPLINSFFYLIGLTQGGEWGITLPGDNLINISAIFNAIIIFVLTALVVYYVIVVPMNKAKDRFGTATEEAEEPTAEELLAEIRDLLKGQNRA